MNHPSRPSHQLPRDVFDAILAIEDSARDAATFYAESQLGAGIAPEGSAAEYMRRVAETGARRDALAELLLARLTTAEVVDVPLIGKAS